MILVTGATGKVGGAVLEQLVQAGHEVRALVRDPNKLGPSGEKVSVVKGDLAKPETLAKVNTLGVKKFAPSLAEAEREAKWDRWQKAVKRSLGWDEAPEED